MISDSQCMPQHVSRFCGKTATHKIEWYCLDCVYVWVSECWIHRPPFSTPNQRLPKYVRWVASNNLWQWKTLDKCNRSLINRILCFLTLDYNIAGTISFLKNCFLFCNILKCFRYSCSRGNSLYRLSHWSFYVRLRRGRSGFCNFKNSTNNEIVRHFRILFAWIFTIV